jgi:hypothetical protein
MSIADTVLMVKPTYFGFNPQTAESNHFQHRVNMETEEVQRRAYNEFTNVVNTLKRYGINVLELDSPAENTPDAVFPNNWFTTHVFDDKKMIFIYPMLCANRKKEVQIDALQKILKKIFPHNKYEVADFRKGDDAILEGTGALIFDHKAKVAFMSLSERADVVLAQTVAERLGYELISFYSVDADEKPIYHTNVMMSMGDKLAFICLEAIIPVARRARIKAKLQDMGKIIIELSLAQVYQMAGNVLELKNCEGHHFLLLSASADKSLNAEQKEIIDQYCQRLPCDISTIETIGGGSVRCMLAEVFH